MKNVLKVLLAAVAWLVIFVLGSTTGLIHPACYAYVGALLPLLFAFVYLFVCRIIPGFGAAAVLNGFVLVALLLAGEADTACIVGFVALAALAELIRALCKDAKKGIRWSFVPLAYSFFAYTAHWWFDTEASLAAAVAEMPAGYDQLMKPVIENIPALVVALILTFPIAILSMRLAEKVVK
ncbi:MAG: MptD family putative ECF transporter S component [Bacteroidales bacterium]|nr:MptD family putative ECF transporter S component [Bacteroidales bacterium]